MKHIYILGLASMLAACSDEPETTVASEPVVVVRQNDAMQIVRGGEIFAKNCAKCHGEQAEGDANWRQRDASGRFPPPPLNGTAHAWHHPLEQLRQVIVHGSPGGKGNMPAWKDKLTAQDIDDVIAWFQAKWPDEVYTAWYEINVRATQR